MKLLSLLAIFVTGCAPVAKSIAKPKPCELSDHAARISLGQRSYDVNSIMNLSYNSNVDLEGNIVWTYSSCITVRITFNTSDQVIAVAE